MARVERSDQPSMRRFTCLTNAFSKIDNHIRALALYFVFYNFTRIHKSLRMSPAMTAGITDRLWSLKDVCCQDRRNGTSAEAARANKRRGE